MSYNKIKNALDNLITLAQLERREYLPSWIDDGDDWENGYLEGLTKALETVIYLEEQEEMETKSDVLSRPKKKG